MPICISLLSPPSETLSHRRWVFQGHHQRLLGRVIVYTHRFVLWPHGLLLTDVSIWVKGAVADFVAGTGNAHEDYIPSPSPMLMSPQFPH